MWNKKQRTNRAFPEPELKPLESYKQVLIDADEQTVTFKGVDAYYDFDKDQLVFKNLIEWQWFIDVIKQIQPSEMRPATAVKFIIPEDKDKTIPFTNTAYFPETLLDQKLIVQPHIKGDQ